MEEAAGEGGGAGGSQPIKVGGRSRMPSDEIDKFSDGAQAPNSFPHLGGQLFSFVRKRASQKWKSDGRFFVVAQWARA